MSVGRGVDFSVTFVDHADCLPTLEISALDPRSAEAAAAPEPSCGQPFNDEARTWRSVTSARLGLFTVVFLPPRGFAEGGSVVSASCAAVRYSPGPRLPAFVKEALDGHRTASGLRILQRRVLSHPIFRPHRDRRVAPANKHEVVRSRAVWPAPSLN